MARKGKSEFATIRRLPSKRWQVRYTGPDGIRRPAPHTFPFKADAEAYVDVKRREIYRDQWVADTEDVMFAGYAQAWLDGRQVAGRPIKERTRAHYQTILVDHLVPAFGDKPLKSITVAGVRAWYAGTLTDRPTLRAHTYSLLRTILATAVVDELIESNPVRIVGAGSSKRVHAIRPASVEEISALAAKMPARLSLMVTLASWCALRFGEVIELRRGDIDIEGQVIRIRRAAVRVGGAYRETSPKSAAGSRDVYIPPHVMPAIMDHLVHHTDAGTGALLFPADNGGRLQPSTLYRHWYKARAEISRPDLRFHDLRHSGAVLAAGAGASLIELMDRLGHSTPGAALRYQHVATGRAKAVADAMSELATS